MCGIAGIFAYSPDAPPVDRDEISRICDKMKMRGPDGSGEWGSTDCRVTLGHRRLAIIDLTDAGAQPMGSSDGSLVITFNGEIYNYRELRSELELKGFIFRTNSDTEVLLHLYAERGADMVHSLRGMYAFAIWDERKKGIFLARDPFGIKPLYFSDDGRTLRVASQVKALLAGGNVDTSPEPAGHVGFFLWGHVPEPYTLYRGIRALPAGSSLWLAQSSGTSTTLRTSQIFCSIPDVLKAAEQQPLSMHGPELREYLRETLMDSVRHHLVADVPVGMFLSSGLDSSTLTALASEIVSEQLHTVTLGFREYQGTENDEVPLAEQVARQYGTTHKTIWVEKQDFQGDLQRLLDAMDQPSIDGINSFFVSKAAVQAGLKVVLSGLGGDELFGSYPSFQQIPRLVNRVRPFATIPGLGRGFRLVSAPLLANFTSPKYSGILEYGDSFSGAYLLRRGMFMPWELPRLLDAEMVKEGWRELQTMLRLEETVGGIANNHLKVSALEMCWYMRNQLLRDTDWASMAHSLETRVPFVDLRVMKRLAPLFAGTHQVSKREMAATPFTALPSEVTMRPKTGFSVPTNAWIQESLPVNEPSLRGWAKLLHARQFTASVSTFSRYKWPAIMVFRVGQLGDTLVAMPAIHAIRKKHPLHRMVLLTDRHEGKSGYVSSWDILGPTGWFDDVLFYNPSAMVKRTIINLKNITPAIRAINPEHVYDLSPDRTPSQSKRDRFFFSQVIRTKNYHQFGPSKKISRVTDIPLPHVDPEWKRLLSITAEKANISISDSYPPFEITIPGNNVIEAKALLALNNIADGTRLIAIGPGSKMPAKLWPKEFFCELGRIILNSDSDLQLVVLGGKEDLKLGDELCAKWGERAHNFAGKLTIYGSAAVLKKCIGYVGNDTGTMHLAGMAGTPCVAIFSARDYSGKWVPYGDNHAIIRKEIDCSGCMLEVCTRDNACLKQISVDQVIKAMEGIMKS